MTRIKITGAHLPTLWYAPRIGEEFNVLGDCGFSYYVGNVDPKNPESICYVNKIHCVIIPPTTMTKLEAIAASRDFRKLAKSSPIGDDDGSKQRAFLALPTEPTNP